MLSPARARVGSAEKVAIALSLCGAASSINVGVCAGVSVERSLCCWSEPGLSIRALAETLGHKLDIQPQRRRRCGFRQETPRSSVREVEEMLLERGFVVSYETIRPW